MANDASAHAMRDRLRCWWRARQFVDLFVRALRFAVAAAAIGTTARIIEFSWPSVLARARLEFSLEWSDEPIWLMARNFREAGDLYKPLEQMTGYVYGPGLGLLLSMGDRLGATSLPQMRAVSIASALLGTGGFFLITRALACSEGKVHWSRRWVWPILAAAVATCILTLNVTFEALHPDNLAIGLVSLGAAGFLRIAGARAGWRAMVATGLTFGIAFASKQTTIVVFAAGALAFIRYGKGTAKAIAFLIASFVASAALVFSVAGIHGWDWAFRVPGRHHYQFTAARMTGLMIDMFRNEYHLGLLMSTGLILSAATLFRDRDKPERALYAAMVLGSCASAMGAYFKARGIWNNLYFPAIMALPLIFGEIAREVAPLRRVLGSLAICGLPFVHPNRAMPGVEVLATIERTQVEAQRLCAEYGRLTVLWPMYSFRECPSARPVLFESYAEIQHAALANPLSLVRAAIEAGGAVVTGSNMRLPELLALGFQEDRLTPTVYGWGHHFFPTILTVYHPPLAFAPRAERLISLGENAAFGPHR
jgi:hypothetical protein